MGVDPHPLPLSVLPPNVKVLQKPDGGWSYVIGTAHVSQVSVEHVREVIQLVRPNTVVLELCRSRIGILVEQQAQETEGEVALHPQGRVTVLRTFRQRKGTAYGSSWVKE